MTTRRKSGAAATAERPKSGRGSRGGKTAQQSADSQRALMARRHREDSEDSSECGPLPEGPPHPRREACRLDLGLFLRTYFPNSTGLSPFSADHNRVIARIQSSILEGGRRLNACFRGFA